MSRHSRCAIDRGYRFRSHPEHVARHQSGRGWERDFPTYGDRLRIVDSAGWAESLLLREDVRAGEGRVQELGEKSWGQWKVDGRRSRPLRWVCETK